MKMYLFLFLSMALHAAALAYPALHLESRNLSPVVVTVLDADGGSAGASKGAGAAPEKKSAPAARKPALEKPRAQSLPNPEQIAELPGAIPMPVILTDVSSPITISAGWTKEAGDLESSSPSIGVGSGGSGTDGSGTSRGVKGAGSGDGRGRGNGGPQSVKASYDYCPRPEYSENLEGTVLLQVVVDEEGRPKSLEVNKSSGFAVLDQAAVKHVKQRCRFHPARYGDKRVESLVEFPVVFKLADLRH